MNERRIYEYRVDDQVYALPTECIDTRDNCMVKDTPAHFIGELGRFLGFTTTEILQGFYQEFKDRLTLTIIDFDGERWRRVVVEDIVRENGIPRVVISRGRTL